MAAGPEISPRYRSTDRWDGANYAVFNPSRVADHITDSLGGQALLVGPEPWPAVRNRSSSAAFDAASVATDRSSGCTQLSAASKLSLRAVLRFIAVLADAVLLVIRPPAAIHGWSSGRRCLRLENLSSPLFALFPAEKEYEGLCWRNCGSLGDGCYIYPCIWLGAESYLSSSGAAIRAPRRRTKPLQP